jgi:DNA-binding SARP family transcriptional activator
MMKNIRPPDSRKIGLRVFSLIQWHVITAVYTALGSGSPGACLDAVNSGLALSREHGIHVFDPLLLYFGAASCVVTGNDAAADGFLGEMVSSRARFNEMQLAYYISILAWIDLIKGDARSAAARLGMVLPVTEKLGHTINTIANHIGLAHALFELGEKEKALRHLAKARALHGMDSRWFEYVFLVTEAYFALKEGRETDGLKLTGRAMALSRQQGVTVFVYWRPAMLSLLCNKALEAGIETDYVKSVIRKHRLEPDDSNLGSERWPWPLRIYALGRFEIFRDDVPLEFSGKTPQKPLELFKALIAFGGQNVPVETLSDAVWPDAEGDLAHQSFESALSRLRRLLGEEDCIKYSARQLSIDRKRCWVDSIALENILGSPEASRNERCIEVYEQAACLYKGEFLPTDASREWAVSRNETLKNRLLRVIAEAGRLYERKGQWESAAECYQKGLHADRFVEELYRRLMICYQRLGRRAEAVQLYDRCRRLLQANLGIGPSPTTEAVYSSILKSS